MSVYVYLITRDALGEIEIVEAMPGPEDEESVATPCDPNSSVSLSLT